MVSVFIFHRDLRIEDNTTLIELSKLGHVVPIFILSDKQVNLQKNKFGNNSLIQFMCESLYELSENIKKYQGKLYFFKDINTINVLEKLSKIIDISCIGFNYDYTPFAKKRDKEILKWCKQHNISSIVLEDYLLNNTLDNMTKKSDGTEYKVFTAFKNHCVKLTVRYVNRFNKFRFKKYDKVKELSNYFDIKNLKELYTVDNNVIVHGGRTNGLKIIKNIEKFKNYNRLRNDTSYQTTHLSAHNKFGTISIREVYYSIYNKLGRGSILLNELYWRDFYYNIINDNQHILHGKSYKPEYDKVKWSYDKYLFKQWCTAKTGFPIVDAGMTEINTTSYMHNRCRMIVAMFLCKILHVDWRLGEKYFAQKLIDYDPSVNNSSWQWVSGSGCDAQPYFRIFNPWNQTIKFDKECTYIKKWLPVFKNIPNKHILKWYDPKIRNMYNINYPEPIVDYKKERERTIRMLRNI